MKRNNPKAQWGARADAGGCEIRQEGPRTLVFAIGGREAVVEYARDAIEPIKRLIEKGPVRMAHGSMGETLIFCGDEESGVPGVKGKLIALISPGDRGRA